MAAGSSCPTYLSARSADVILSDVRPVRIAPAALRALNVLLDELLWTVLAHARSLDTDRLHQALRKVLPTSLGKEALLEAEVELRAYLEKSPPISAQPADEEFALQYAFELLRIKCEAYATLNDQDEDNDAEAKLHLQNTGSVPPSASLIAPAALYLTAILECVCEHVLSTVSRVASRDSSRTTATVQDLFVALCEDSSIFGLFKSMKVYAQIQEMTTESSHNRRKSFSQQGERPSSRTESPSSQDHTSSKGSGSSAPRRPSVTSMKTRVSSDSKRPRAGSPAFRRASLDKARALAERVSGSRSSIEREEVPQVSGDDISRTQSGISENTKQVWRAFHDAHNSDRSSDPEEDGGLDFDEALRSGSTVKVSLTPDRLKSMETHKQGRRGNSRLNTSSTLSPVTPSDDEGTPIAAKPTPPPARQPLAGTRRPSVPQVPQVASIQEDDEEGPAPALLPSAFSSAHSTPAIPSSQPPPPIRRRSGSMTTAVSAGASQRQRTMSTPRSVDLLAPKPKIIQTPQRPSHNELSGAPSAFPQKKRVVAKNRESMDLDDIMNGSDDEEDELDGPSPTAVPTTPRQGGAPGARGTPQRTPGGGVSRSTRDLMDFLQSGPPDDMMSPPTPLSRQNTGGNGTTSSKKDRAGGRLQRMMSRLRSGVSQEQLNKRAKEDDYAVPPTPPLPGSALNTGGLAGASRVNVNGATVIAYKPPRPPKPPQVPQPIVPSESPTDVTPTSINRSTSAISTSSPSTPVGSMPISPPASPLNGSLSRKSSNVVSGSTTPAQVPTPPSTSAQRRMSIQRKAVPSWIEDKAIIQPEPTIITTAAAGNALHTPEPSSEASGGLSPVIPSPVNEEVRPLRPIRKNSAQSVRSEVSPSQLPPGLEGTQTKDGEVVSEPTSSGDVAVVPKTQAASVDTATTPSLTDMMELRQLMSHATSAEECRLLYDMFLVRSGVSLFPASTEFKVPYPSPVRSETAELPTASFIKARPSPIDPSLVEVLLGGGGGSVPTTPIYEFHDDASGDSRPASPVRDTLTVEA